MLERLYKEIKTDLFRIKLPLAQPFKSKFSLLIRNHKNAAVQLVQALRYQPEGRGFDFRSRHWDFLINLILLAALWAWGQLSL
jgi:hypothetical protein